MAIKMNISAHSTHMCESLYDGKHFLIASHKLVLIVANIIIMLLNVATNSAVIYILLKKRLLNNNSMRLMLYLSISDIFVAIIGQPVFLIVLVKQTSSFALHCTMDTVAEFINVFTIHIPAYTVVLIGSDRYCRLKYLHNYPEKVTVCMINIAMSVVTMLSFFHGLLLVLGTQLHFFHIANIIAVSLDVCLILLTFLAYMMAMAVVKKHRRSTINKTLVSSIEKKVTSMSSRILLSLIILYIPYIATAIMHHWCIDTSEGELRQRLNFALFLGYVLMCANSSANAILFLTLHKSISSPKKIINRFVKKQNTSTLRLIKEKDVAPER